MHREYKNGSDDKKETKWYFSSLFVNGRVNKRRNRGKKTEEADAKDF